MSYHDRLLKLNWQTLESRRTFSLLFYVVKALYGIIFYMGMVIYTPALALNAATGMSLTASIISTGLVCIFYTTIGGIKAVLWTDAFQTLVMAGGIVAIIIAGTMEVGGFNKVWAIADEGERINFFDMRTDLTIRNTFWTVTVGTFMTTFHAFGMNQAIAQRCLSLGSVQKAKRAIGVAVLAEWAVIILMGLSGVVMYSYYFDCDPYTDGKVFSPDQIMPYMVMEVFAKTPGIPGIFLSSVISASLSTLSSGLNAMAAVAGEDIIKILWPRIQEKTYTAISKLLCLVFGFLAIGVAFLAMGMGDQVLEIGISIAGLTRGAVIATYTLGVCSARINNKGIILGTVVSTGILIWIKVGKTFADNIRSDRLSLSVEGCVLDENSTNLTYYSTTPAGIETLVSFTESSPNETANAERTVLENFYSLSFHLYGTFGFLMTVVVAIIVSAITGFNDPESVNKRLLIDIGDAFCCFLPRWWQRKLHIVDDVIDDEQKDVKIRGMTNGTAYEEISQGLVESPTDKEYSATTYDTTI
ncbi:sodium-coupled monocarboxylate transporter 2-like isoform X1 [Lytechinus pictus]|uniref:sodium-coupled monocarboxylate transporter 2-like isoform X1 n=2 Tax=Lytechinus pictus TaxID=7653 RepID=UPI0030B9D7D3